MKLAHLQNSPYHCVGVGAAGGSGPQGLMQPLKPLLAVPNNCQISSYSFARQEKSHHSHPNNSSIAQTAVVTVSNESCESPTLREERNCGATFTQPSTQYILSKKECWASSSSRGYCTCRTFSRTWARNTHAPLIMPPT